ASQAVSAANSAESAANDAESAASTIGHEVGNLEDLVRHLQGTTEELQDNSFESLAADVESLRRHVWWAFAVDSWKYRSANSENLSNRVHKILSRGIALDATYNLWEITLWRDLLTRREEQRSRKGTLRWWSSMIASAQKAVENPNYDPPQLPDIRAELLVDVDRAIDDPGSITRQFVDRLDD
ncbi:hypothetical protein WDZ92_52590, partial [Nostoc sp. NIES-2111]